MFVHDMREGGMYAVETYYSVASEPLAHGRLETTSCAVAYADRDRPSHCVRIFMFSNQPQTAVVRR